MQTNLVFALCGRNAWGAARKELNTLRELAQSLPNESTEATSLHIQYLEGAICQGTGDTATALSIFSSPDFALETQRKGQLTGVRRDLSILSALNAALIIHVPDHPQSSYLPELVASLEPFALQSQSYNIRAAFRFVRAVLFNVQPESGSLLKTKENLAAVLKDAKHTANSQLLCLTLNFMAEKFFRGVVSGQSLKSARSAVQFARKGQNDLWTSVADGLLAETFETQGQNEEASQVRREALDIAGRLPLVMQREAEGGLPGPAGGSMAS